MAASKLYAAVAVPPGYSQRCFVHECWELANSHDISSQQDLTVLPFIMMLRLSEHTNLGAHVSQQLAPFAVGYTVCAVTLKLMLMLLLPRPQMVFSPSRIGVSL